MRHFRIKFFRAPDGEGAGGAAPAAAPAASEAAPSAPAPTSMPSNDTPQALADMFKADPFGNSEPAPTTSAPASTPAPTPTPAPAPTPAAATVPPTPAAPAAPTPTQTPGTDEMALLREQLARTQGQLEALRAQPQDQPPSGAAPADDTPEYNYTIPNELAQALVSDDPRERLGATTNLIKGVSRSVHQQVVASIRREVAQVIPMFVQNLVAQREQMQMIRNDFYSAHPKFNNPSLRPLITSIGNELVASGVYKEWGPALRDAIAARAEQVIAGVVPSAPAPAPVLTAPSAAPRPAVVPAAPTNAGEQLREIFTQ